MKKLIPIIIILFCFTCVAQAKVTYNNSIVADIHLNTIKGLLYNLTHPEYAITDTEKQEIQVLLPKFSKAVVWLMARHNSATSYRLERLRNEEAKTVMHAITMIVDLVQGKYPGIPTERALARWTRIGSRVQASYQIVSNKPVQIKWKFELAAEESRTQNLVFRYEAEVMKIENL
jgi:hypothetical protein